MSDGWVKLHRKAIEWEWFKKPFMFRLFSYLVMSANREDGKWQGYDIKRGQLATGRRSLSDATGISQQSIRTCLTRLQQTGEINQQINHLFSIITIVNYDTYQSCEEKSTSKSTFNQPAINQPSTTNKKLRSKEEDNYNVGQPEETAPQQRENIPFSEVVSYLNRKVGSQFKPTADTTKRFIRARWREGFRLKDFQTVIDSKFFEWGTSSEMLQYLRPQTLFGTKFESYLQNAVIFEKPREEKVYVLPDLDELRRKKQAEKQTAVDK
jgi:uncharacterized phage protein (TIGR02220 family)